MNLEKSELDPKQVFDFIGYQFRPQRWPGPAHTGLVADPAAENTEATLLNDLSGLAVHVLYRSANSHSRASSPQPSTHETHTVAPEKYKSP